MSTNKNNDYETDVLLPFLDSYKKKLSGIIQSNQKSVDKKRKKLNRKKYKFEAKTSENRRNVLYFQNELEYVEKAISDINCNNKETYSVDQAIAKLELNFIKKEMNMFLIYSLVIYLTLYIIFSIYVPMASVLMPLFMLLISMFAVNLYENKCQQYNSFQSNKEKQISESDIKIEKPFLIKSYAKGLWILAIVMIIIGILNVVIFNQKLS